MILDTVPRRSGKEALSYEPKHNGRSVASFCHITLDHLHAPLGHAYPPSIPRPFPVPQSQLHLLLAPCRCALVCAGFLPPIIFNSGYTLRRKVSCDNPSIVYPPLASATPAPS